MCQVRSDSKLKISMICPVLNEEKFIEKIFDFYKKSQWKNKELFIVDGGSTDKTKEITLNNIKKDSSIHFLENTHKYVPYALNIAIPLCIGDIIVRLDAHTEYDILYLEKIIETFEKTNADIVGGHMRPIGVSIFQKAVSIATSNKFGIGNSHFHDVNYEGYVDSVYLGAWKKEIFYDVGLFDENFIRNQDDEFHYRAKKFGKRIYLDSKIKSYYFPRTSAKKLFSQYFQYGLFKPLVLYKIKAETKFRHLIPPLFLCYITIIPLFLFFDNIAIIIPLFIYFSLCIYISFGKREHLSIKVNETFIYPIIHISYGLGFLIGLFKILHSQFLPPFFTAFSQKMIRN